MRAILEAAGESTGLFVANPPHALSDLQANTHDRGWREGSHVRLPEALPAATDLSQAFQTTAEGFGHTLATEALIALTFAEVASGIDRKQLTLRTFDIELIDTKVPIHRLTLLVHLLHESSRATVGSAMVDNPERLDEVAGAHNVDHLLRTLEHRAYRHGGQIPLRCSTRSTSTGRRR